MQTAAAFARRSPIEGRHRLPVPSRCVSGRCDGLAVWLPWCFAPLWVCLPIVGCLLAGAVRRPAAASGPPQPVETPGPSADEIATRLVPIPPLASVNPR